MVSGGRAFAPLRAGSWPTVLAGEQNSRRSGGRPHGTAPRGGRDMGSYRYRPTSATSSPLV